MRILKCDKCGAEFDYCYGDFQEEDVPKICIHMPFADMTEPTEMSYDLCADCIAKIRKFIDNAEAKIVIEEDEDEA